MASHLEVELKWALEPSAHDALAPRLAEALGPAHELAQENRFFDSAARALRAQLMSVRLRREDGRLVLTCKRRLPKRHGAHAHDEWEREVDLALWEAPASELAGRLPLPPHIVGTLAGAPLVALGGFANRRREHRDGDDLLCLDRTDFGVRIDHELEIETPDPAAASRIWSERLDAWRIPWRPQPQTKFSRYLTLSGQA